MEDSELRQMSQTQRLLIFQLPVTLTKIFERFIWVLNEKPCKQLLLITLDKVKNLSLVESGLCNIIWAYNAATCLLASWKLFLAWQGQPVPCRWKTSHECKAMSCSGMFPLLFFWVFFVFSKSVMDIMSTEFHMRVTSWFIHRKGLPSSSIIIFHLIFSNL